MKKLWNKLNTPKRYALLVKAYPARSWELHNFEAKLTWDKLLLSTKRDLERLAAEVANGGSDQRSEARSDLPQKQTRRAEEE